MKAVNHLEVILKTSSRCNINCSYCYYFYGGDDSWKSRAKKIQPSTLIELIVFLNQAVDDHDLESIQIDFHGGEPLLQGKKAFNDMCLLFKHKLSSKVKLSFALQTNATLVDEGWVDLFVKHQVSVSVSLDGPKTVNDAFRIDHKGHSTFDKTKKGIALLKEAELQNRLGRLNLLSVINPWAHGSKVYRYFVDELGIESMDFLLPAKERSKLSASEVKKVGQFLLDVWQAWVGDNNPNIRIRFFEAFFASLSGQKSFLYPSAHYGETGRLAMTVETDGQVMGDDSLRSNAAWKEYPKLHVRESTFKDFYQAEEQWHKQHAHVPSNCKTCLWGKVCGGGQLEHRYSNERGYNNPSAYCDALYRVYSEILEFLYEHGMDKEQIYKALAA